MAECSFIDYRLQSRGVAVLTLDNPPLNLTTLVTLDKLLSACRDIARDEQVRTVVVTGSGSKAFCAGSDIGEFVHVRDDVVSRKLARENIAFTALEQLPMPVIAALNGVALGGGAEIALACDIRIMDETARIGFPEVKLGIFPGSGGIFRLPRLVGPAKAYELLYTGELIDAHEAHRIGLVNRLAPAGQALSAAVALAESLASRPARSR
jgi:enoyl-CoA hydratase/carnithine racemase